ncbi:MAG: hypothetical protein WBA93_15590 [Microcoleaceae cyanobacterium]
MNENHKIIGRWRTLSQMKHREDIQQKTSDRRKTRAERLQKLRANDNQMQSYKYPAKYYSNQQKHSVSQTGKTEQKRPKSTKKFWSISWLLWIALLVIIPAGAGITAISTLFKLPSQPDCESIYWPTVSGSKRLYCAQVLATSQTADGLLQAINLVEVLSKDHPMRPQINNYIEEWSEKILSLGDLAFQNGKLEEAIKIAQKVPQQVSAYTLVETQIQAWQKTWNQAEATYKKTQEHLRNERWNQASMEASGLLSVPNSYWETKKYQELVNDIKKTRKEGGKLNQARETGEKGGLDNLSAAIKEAQEIDKNSYIYQLAQKLVLNFGEQIVDLAMVELNEGDWQKALRIVNKVPENEALQKKVEDIKLLARAHSPASLGTVAGLEDAITQVQQLSAERPLFGKAKQLISLWQQEIADVTIIEEGKKLAQPGGMSDLKGAIAKLQTIPPSNIRGQEASSLIEGWSRQLQQQEDRPILEKADKLASFGDVNSLQAAIAEASQIGRGRTLYEEAQNNISRWSERVQRFQDQPILEEAEALALAGDIDRAIAKAQEIRPGRIIYDRARSKIEQWQSQQQVERSLENARQAAVAATADAYIKAITLAEQVPTSSSRRWEASELINQWSQQILLIAMDEVNRDLPRAIEIARKIPENSIAYNSAQRQISIWQGWLNPSPSLEYQSPTPQYRAPLQDESVPPTENQSSFDFPSPQPENETTLTDERGKPLVSEPKFPDSN